MKSIIILGDGMSDHPVAALNGKTPLMVARKPHIDFIAKMGKTGLFATIPEGMSNGSAVANLSVLGYDPRVCFKGRGVLEAASMQVALKPADVAMRCNLLTIDTNGKIKNHSAGHISNAEAHEIIADLQKALGEEDGDTPLRFHPGVSYRHLLVLDESWAVPDVECAPPHDFVGVDAISLYPKAKTANADTTARKLVELHDKARKILENHPVNLKRIAAGKDPANAIWTWSPGTRPHMDTIQTLYGKSGAVISAVDLVQGLGVLAGMEKIVVEGATGLHDTNYEGKAQAALDALARHDVVYVHVEATDEAGHEKNLALKIKCIEYLDERLVKPILEGIQKSGIEATVSILPDHPTPVETGAHDSDPVPFAIWNPREPGDSVERYDEESVRKGGFGLIQGNAFFRLAINS
ncbi:MAG: cofactor-independent phosphoglycerate mutase [Deltaproteobacteria bacterium]|nr:cofactor-independent phosphoglycerate mutase [Deltaproteobacteria bacterium]